MFRVYRYVGPVDLRAAPQEPPHRTCVRSPQDVRAWVEETQPELQGGEVVATFVIDPEGRLWIADRHSEHVQCARGAEVLSAGEMTFGIGDRGVEVTAVTNQSTGFCPEPRSWEAVAAALDRAGLRHGDGFTTEFVFRWCAACGTTNIVKDAWFACAVCERALPAEWNYDPAT